MIRSLIKSSIIVGSLAATCFAIPFSASANKVVSSGTFEGRSDHVTKGGVSIFKTDDSYIVVLDSKFFLDGAPDPKLGFGKDGEYDPDTTFAVLQANTGTQTYVVRTSAIDVTEYNEVYVWCDKFDVPLGVASLK